MQPPEGVKNSLWDIQRERDRKGSYGRRSVSVPDPLSHKDVMAAGHLISPALEFALLAEAVDFSLAGKVPFVTERARILERAVRFFEPMIRAGEVLKTLRLEVTSPEDLKRYRWGVEVYALMTKTNERVAHQKPSEMFARLHMAARHIACGQEGQVAEEDIADLKAFFKSLEELTAPMLSGVTDKVRIG